MKTPVKFDAASLREALIARELLDRPLALRRCPRPAGGQAVGENRSNEIKTTKE